MLICCGVDRLVGLLFSADAVKFLKKLSGPTVARDLSPTLKVLTVHRFLYTFSSYLKLCPSLQIFPVEHKQMIPCITKRGSNG
jgi:hypothetical protein